MHQESVDGLYGWVVVFGAFMVHVICDGITYAFGIIMTELLEEFKEGASLTAWVSSILVGVTLCSGPIASALANHFGCRKIVILGSCLAAVGTFLTCFATGILYLIATVGVIMGLGFGMMFCPSVIIVNLYFAKRRSLAVGIVVCGAGVGTFIFAPLSEALIKEFTWRGTFLIYTGIVLNGCVFGALFRYPKAMQPSGEQNSSAVQIIIEEPDEDKHLILNGNKEPNQTSIYQDRLAVAAQPFRAHSRSETMLERQRQKELAEHRRYFSFMTEEELHLYHPHKVIHHAGRPLRPLERKDIFYSGTVPQQADDRCTEMQDLMQQKQADRSRGISENSALSRSSEELPEGGEAEEQDFWQDMKKALHQMTDLSLLKNPVFVLIAISNLLTNIGYDLPRVFLPDHARHFDIDPLKAAWLLSIWGITNTIGRVIIGYIADKSWAESKRLYIYNFCLMACGIVNFFSLWCRDYASLVIYAALFGVTLSTYISLTSVVIVDLLGLEKLTNAFGLLLFFQGIGAIVGPPIGGMIVESTGNYANSFFFAGCALFLSGAMLCPIPCIIRRQALVKKPQGTPATKPTILH